MQNNELLDIEMRNSMLYWHFLDYMIYQNSTHTALHTTITLTFEKTRLLSKINV